MASGPYERFYPGEDKGLLDPTWGGGPYRLNAPSISHKGSDLALSLLGGSAAGYGAKLGYQGIVRGGQALDRVLPALKTIIEKGSPAWGEWLLDYCIGKQTEKEVEKVVKKVQERREPVSRQRTGRVSQLGLSNLSGGSWYSRAEDAVVNADQEKGDAGYWINRIGEAGGRKELGMTGGGVVFDTLKENKGSMSKSEVLGLLQPYTIKLKEKYYTSPHRAEGRYPEPRWAGYPELSLQGYHPGNPVEIVLSLDKARFPHLSTQAPFVDSDWPGVADPVVHVRGNDGKLFNSPAFIIQEIQSKWAQKGNAIGFLDSDGYQTPVTPLQAKRYFEIEDEAWEGMTERQQRAYAMEMEEEVHHPSNPTKQPPDMPYKTTWHELGFKRALMEALRDPHKKYLAWTTGEAQARRNYGDNWEVDWPKKAKFPLQLYNEKIVNFA